GAAATPSSANAPATVARAFMDRRFMDLTSFTIRPDRRSAPQRVSRLCVTATRSGAPGPSSVGGVIMPTAAGAHIGKLTHLAGQAPATDTVRCAPPMGELPAVGRPRS